MQKGYNTPNAAGQVQEDTNAKAARKARKGKKKAKAVEAMVKIMRKQKSMRFIDSDDADPVSPPMAVDEIVEGMINGLSTWLADIENGMSSLGDELMDTLMQAEEEQIKQIKGMFHSYKANIKNLHRCVDNLSATVSTVSEGLQKTQIQVQQEAQCLQDDIKALKDISHPEQGQNYAPKYALHSYINCLLIVYRQGMV
ncbi:hypothetical protein C0995_011342 [Termitomyces sp. Mi166|nr:hypothetical protein C0995_011342 [Termitomyces sp. Mi166\